MDSDEKGPSADDKVRVFDTSLRDGEQAPGFSMSVDGKFEIAKALAALNVDVIEAGFAAVSEGDARAIATIAEQIEGPKICSLARARRSDIDAAADALKLAYAKRIHVFISTSPIHRSAKLGMDCAQVLEAIRSSVSYARESCVDVEFSAEDACRTEPEFLIECLSVAAASGASTLNVPDTVGYAMPDEVENLFRLLKTWVDCPPGMIFSAHCHDDLGLACANSLAAIRGGARQVECTLHGIGERAGNCAMEEVVMALRTRRQAYDVDTNIDISKLGHASQILRCITGVSPPPNKAIVGANAFAHESGIHQHGVLMDRSTYEIMRPEELGLKADLIVLGKHSGRHAFIAKAFELGFEFEREAVEALFAEFKSEADRLGTVPTAWFAAFLEERLGASHPEQRA
jgi:2-isopropylmalate synthase